MHGCMRVRASMGECAPCRCVDTWLQGVDEAPHQNIHNVLAALLRGSHPEYRAAAGRAEHEHAMLADGEEGGVPLRVCMKRPRDDAIGDVEGTE